MVWTMWTRRGGRELADFMGPLVVSLIIIFLLIVLGIGLYFIMVSIRPDVVPAVRPSCL